MPAALTWSGPAAERQEFWLGYPSWCVIAPLPGNRLLGSNDADGICGKIWNCSAVPATVAVDVPSPGGQYDAIVSACYDPDSGLIAAVVRPGGAPNVWKMAFYQPDGTLVSSAVMSTPLGVANYWPTTRIRGAGKVAFSTKGGIYEADTQAKTVQFYPAAGFGQMFGGDMIAYCCPLKGYALWTTTGTKLLKPSDGSVTTISSYKASVYLDSTQRFLGRVDDYTLALFDVNGTLDRQVRLQDIAGLSALGTDYRITQPQQALYSFRLDAVVLGIFNRDVWQRRTLYLRPSDLSLIKEATPANPFNTAYPTAMSAAEDTNAIYTDVDRYATQLLE